MDFEEDNPEDFLLAVSGQTAIHTPVVEPPQEVIPVLGKGLPPVMAPAIVLEEGEDSIEDFLLAMGVARDSHVVPFDNPEGARINILRLYPNSDPEIVRSFVEKAGADHVQAALEQSITSRAKIAMSLYFQYGSWTQLGWPQKNNQWKQCSQAASELRETGLVVTREAFQNEGSPDARYTIDLRTFEGSRSIREYLNKREQAALFAHYGGKCALCSSTQKLELDHRVACAVGGANLARSNGLSAWQLLCQRCNLKKRSECATCPNMKKKRDPTVCESCMWANPQSYLHVQMIPGRQFSWFVQSAEQVEASSIILQEVQARGPEEVLRLIQLSGKKP